MMFKRKSVYAAVLAGLGAIGVAGTASAVHVNPDGLGQVLIYPYYTVRSATSGAASGEYNTYVSVTNTTNSHKAVKVRFLEGKASAEVLDFNLFLSPHDVWTASVEPTASGAMLVSSDKSCTNGVIPASGQAFSNAVYAAGVTDGETTSLDRTREGYIEIIEMGDIPPNYPVADSIVTGTGSLQTAVTHVNGVAPCTASVMAAVDVGSTPDSNLAGLLPGTGGLAGTASLVNPSTGAEYTYDAVALEDWAALAHGFASSSSAPTIANGDILWSDSFVGANVYTSIFALNRDATAAAISRNHVINEFVLDTTTASKTDWVVTFPVKAQYVGRDTCNGGLPCSGANTTRDHAAAVLPFNEQFGLGGSCDVVGLTQYSREEDTPAGAGGFSPGVSSTPKLCWESNVISFNRSTVSPLTSGVLGSVNVKNIDTTYQNGWVDLSFTNVKQILTPLVSGVNGVVGAVQPVYGLPVVGFMVQDFVNGNLGGVLSTYGGNFAHKYTRCVETAALHAAAPHVSTANCR